MGICESAKRFYFTTNHYTHYGSYGHFCSPLCGFHQFQQTKSSLPEDFVNTLDRLTKTPDKSDTLHNGHTCL